MNYKIFKVNSNEFVDLSFQDEHLFWGRKHYLCSVAYYMIEPRNRNIWIAACSNGQFLKIPSRNLLELVQTKKITILNRNSSLYKKLLNIMIQVIYTGKQHENEVLDILKEGDLAQKGNSRITIN
ncbi:hypothetical protein KM915_21100 [Cytobacillus oceanisediminis]|uniref:hypothetical protein n=1 Tax=Cytobacillus oceanisediminis TaxID=665099 RepID=UPI001C221133|nr:hypothetical protein [Cytobacillus oceanisediminis]MBU8732550.1 hypothetical protein [Cytobacillus oceanisediminis]